MTTLRVLYTVYAAGLAGFALVALAVLLFGRSRSLTRRSAHAGLLLLLGMLWPVALLASRGRGRVASILQEHL